MAICRIFARFCKKKRIMNDKLKGGLVVFLGACSFGVLSTIVKNAYGAGYDLGEVTGSQAFFGMVILWAGYWMQRLVTRGRNKASGASAVSGAKPTVWWKVCLPGIFTGLVSVFYYKCVQLIPASIAIILLMQNLWISIILDYLFFRKRPARLQIIAAVIVLGGTLFAGGLFNNEAADVSVEGIAYGLLSGFCYALFILTSGRVGNDLPVFKKSALMITGACVMIFLIFRPTFFFDGTMIGGLYKWGLPLALLGTVIPPLFFSYGMPKTGVSLGAILSAAELPVAVLSSFFILQEHVEWLQWVGVALILGAISMTNIRFRKKETQKSFSGK
jgi:drug/metabolite transporter (DMT)-like permease